MTLSDFIARLEALPRYDTVRPDRKLIAAEMVDALIAEAESECYECGGFGKVLGRDCMLIACPICKGTGRKP